MERALTDVCEELHNWFTPHDGIHADTYTVEGGSIDLPFLKDGQYFRIQGSALNDAVYRYPTTELSDETFTGTVWAMNVPLLVVELAAEIADYQASAAESGSSPYTQEAFGGYSYTKATDSNGAPLTWRETFKSRLNRWRKLP